MISVAHVAGDRYSVRIRDHELVTDQPLDAGGDDAGPTPTELFVAGLAACVAFYAGRFLRRHVDASSPFSVACSYEMSVDRPARVTSVRLTVDVPTVLPDDVRDGLLRAAEHCTVHNTLRMPPAVDISLREAVPSAAALRG
jgi:putative redox protein